MATGVLADALRGVGPKRVRLGVGTASSTFSRFVPEIASFARRPVLDAAGGYGRNSVALASAGCDVVCVDRDLRRLGWLESQKAQHVPSGLGRIQSVCADLDASLWLFGTACFDAVVCVHFVRLELFDWFFHSLRPGGYLYFETFDGHGQNHLALPTAGRVRGMLGDRYELRMYRERQVGPATGHAVTVKLLALKKG